MGMSFVHCPACHRAFDLRRFGSCPACAASADAATRAGASSSGARTPERGPRLASHAPLASLAPGCPRSAPAQAQASSPERIVAMVSELAALLERASTAELELASRALALRGMVFPRGTSPRVAGVGERLLGAGERLLGAGERLLRATDAPRQRVRRLAGRLRTAWAERGAARA
ncbi:MAG: hypothetical protein R3B48_11835 [Kofleriaceae bacterium]